MRFKMFRNRRGFTLIELMIVVAIISLLASIALPRVDIILIKSHQAKTRSNLGALRSALSIYYTENDSWPLASYPPGNTHHSADGLSLKATLTPKYITEIPRPILKDRVIGFNMIDGVNYDIESMNLMAQEPSNDVFIVLGPADFTPFLNSPYAFDNHTGTIYIPNGNFDAAGSSYFFQW